MGDAAAPSEVLAREGRGISSCHCTHYSWLQGRAWCLHLGLVFPSVSSPENPSGLSLAWEPVVVGLGAIQSLTRMLGGLGHRLWDRWKACVFLSQSWDIPSGSRHTHGDLSYRLG